MSNPKFEKLVTEIGKRYEEFVAHLKSDRSKISPNDHIVGPIGEWRAIQVIKKEMNLDASKVSSSAKDPDDLKVEYKGRIYYISVKTTTEHSVTGLSGIFHTDRGHWDWTICIRLHKDLSYKEHFWLHKKDCQQLFKTKTGNPKQFKWSTAINSSKKCTYPSWYQKETKNKKAA